jgi:inorganic pyrophosphatase
MTRDGIDPVASLSRVVYILAAGLALAWLTSPAAAQAPPPAAAALEAEMVVEIPAGSITKYEIDACTGALRVDRFLSMPVRYPANYGYVAGTRAGDGDALDALVLTREPLVPGARLRVRVLGVLRMVDGGEDDPKLIAVPAQEVDPSFAGMRDIGDVPAAERERIEAFFAVYKRLPPGGPPVELRGFGDAHEAGDLLRKALDRGVRQPPCGGAAMHTP